MPTILFMRSLRPILLALGLLTISAGAVLVIAAAQTTILVADHNLSQYWRTSYDILVRPADARSPIEEKYGLVEANHLSGIWGGITFDQYETIKSIPGVEVAAPVAMIGVIPEFVETEALDSPTQPGAYLLLVTIVVHDGALHPDGETAMTSYYYYYFSPDNASQGMGENAPFTSPPVSSFIVFPFVIAGVDPPQEAALVGLDRALQEGKYLSSDEPFTLRSSLFTSSGYIVIAPVLVNVTPYLDMTIGLDLKPLRLPSEVPSLDDIMSRGGTHYLASLPVGDTLAHREWKSSALYQRLLEQGFEGVGMGVWNTPSRTVYREIPSPFSEDDSILEIEMPEGDLGYGPWPSYRSTFTPLDSESELEEALGVKIIGVFDIERLPKPADMSRVPLETYFPPGAILHYDEQGNPVEPPRELRPTLNPAGYIQSPPLLLTTLEAARAVRGDAAISAIRIRVGGIDELTPEAQRKIEAIAIEIAKQTGLTVDIMVGSSPKRILVHVPGIGYVEEQWIQKGVSLIYKQGIQAGNWLLLGTLLAAGGLFTLDMTWAEVVSRRHLIALQKALGWRSRTVFGQILGQVLSLGLAATLVGTVGALGVIQFLNLQPPPDWLVPGLPLVVLGISTLGSLLPAWLASRTPPMVDLRQGGLRYRRTGRRMALGMWGYAWNGLLRRAGRTLLAGLTAVLSAGLLVLLVAVLLEQRGMLGGTLLGEFILVRVQGFHYAIVGIGFGLAAFSTANSLLAGVLERRREIGALKAMGWRTGAVMGLFVLEGALLGLGGGTMGALLGSLTFVYLHHTIVPGLILAMLVGMSVPGLVGALAALYPARVAARVPPAESVRYE